MKPAISALVMAALAGANALPAPLRLTREAYLDRVHAAWVGQFLGMLMGYRFEHKQGAVATVNRLPETFRGKRLDEVPLDDDWYYEVVALRAFEKYGIGLTARQLGRQWVENNAGFWSSSREALRLLRLGLEPPQTGHPRYNRSWFTVGAGISAEIYGLVTPGMPNAAARLARETAHVQGYAEAADNAVFTAGMLSLALAERDSKRIVGQAARLIDPRSPYRQALDQVMEGAQRGRPFAELAASVSERWGPQYQSTNSAVINGALTALAVWSGGGDFTRTVNLALEAGDFTDTDCNAATAAAVVGAMHGLRVLPRAPVAQLGDRMRGEELAGVRITPPLDESVVNLARRTAAIGEKFVLANGGSADPSGLRIAVQEPAALPPELFPISALMTHWNPAWELVGAGLGGEGDALRLSRGSTYLDGETLVTFPRDEIRGVLLRRTLKLGKAPALSLDVGADSGRAWQLEAFAGNDAVASHLIESATRRIEIDLGAHAGGTVQLRLYQRTLVSGRLPSQARWRRIEVR